MSTESMFPTSDTNVAGAAGSPDGNSRDKMSGDGHIAPHGEDLVRRAARGAHATIDRLADSAVPAVARLQRGVEGGYDQLHAGADKVRELGDEWTEVLRTTVREHPVTALVVAVSAGMLIARLMAPSR